MNPIIAFKLKRQGDSFSIEKTINLPACNYFAVKLASNSSGMQGRGS
jgi:hypothetical protein